MLPLRQSIEQNLVQLDLDVNDIPSIIHAAIELAIKQGKLSREDAKRAEDALQRRESEGATAIGHAVAVPHAYLDCFDEQLILFFRLSRPVNLVPPTGFRPALCLCCWDQNQPLVSTLMHSPEWPG